MIETIQQGLKAEDIQVSISKFCDWFAVPRRTFYYTSVKGQPSVQKHFEPPIKAMIKENLSFGYQTVAYLLGFNKNGRIGRNWPTVPVGEHSRKLPFKR